MSKPKQLKFTYASSPQFFRIDEDIKKLSFDRSSFWAIRGTLFVLIVLLSLIVIYHGRLPDRIPLYYSRPWGNEQLASKQYLWLWWTVITVLAGLNWILASRNRSENRVLSKAFIWGGLLLSLMGLIDLLKIYSILSVW